VPADDVRRAEDVREALRTLLLANNAVDVDRAGATEVLDAAARRARLQPEFAHGRLVPRARGVAGAVGAVLAEVHAAMADGSWPRLKACRARDCEYAFVDNARNRSRAWCSMQECGNREKVRSYRERHRSHS
jgi:predicted RNA-binding Zn ribbon-like protein